MNKEMVLEKIFDCYEKATNISNVDEDTYVDFYQRRAVLGEMRKAFPLIRIDMDYTKIATVKDCFQLVSAEVAKRRKIAKVILEAAKKYSLIDRIYDRDEVFLENLNPTANPGYAYEYKGQKMRQYLQKMRFFCKVADQLQYWPDSFFVFEHATLRDWVEIFYWKHKLDKVEAFMKEKKYTREVLEKIIKEIIKNLTAKEYLPSAKIQTDVATKLAIRKAVLERFNLILLGEKFRQAETISQLADSILVKMH